MHEHPPTSADYVARVNRAIDHVLTHLAQPLRLDEVAAAACFSPFHFHRIFKALQGETLTQFVKRQRLARALYLMSHAPGRPLTEVALACGFASSSDFSRSFKQQYGQSPRRFDLQGWRQRGDEAVALALQPHVDPSALTTLPMGENPDGFVATLRTLPARRVAYLRVFDPYRPGAAAAACARMLAWAEAQGIADSQWLGYLWDEPEIVPPAKCRYDVALVLDAAMPEPRFGGEIGRFHFPPMRVAEVIVKGDMALEARAIDWLYRSWLPNSGLVPDEQPAFEAWIGRPFAHGQAHFEIACQLPVTRP